MTYNSSMFFQGKKKTEVYSWYKYILKARILKRGARTRYTESRTSTPGTSHLNHCYDFSNTKGHLGWAKLDKNKANKRKTLHWSRDMFLKFLFWVIWPGILLVRQSAHSFHNDMISSSFPNISAQISS